MNIKLSFKLMSVCSLLIPFLVHSGSQVGQPVNCFFSGSVQPSQSKDFTCLNIAGSPSFIEGQKVPPGLFLLVTDITVTPDAGTDLTGLTDITIKVISGSNSIITSLRLRSTTTDTTVRQFKIPELILSEDFRLEVTSAAFASFGTQVSITGLLVNQLEMPIFFNGYDLVSF